MKRTRYLLATALVLTALSPLACGGTDGSDTSPTAGPGGGSAGAGGGASSVGGTESGGATGAHAGTGTTAGSGGSGGTGATGGTGGSPASGGHGGSGVAGKSGAAGAVSGTGGSSGHAGDGNAGGGHAGSGTSGSGGNAGSPPTGCKVDDDCTASIPPTNPAKCATGKCDATLHTCSFVSVDADKDGYGTALCMSTNGVAIVTGGDCDDTNPAIHPGAWDGPAGDGHTTACDGVDQNCDGLIDNGKLMNGATCTCAPNDTQHCSTNSAGQPITYPGGKPVGECVYGAQTCLASGAWGPCTGAIGPAQESCDHLDNDCNGIVDDGSPPDNVPFDAVYWAYDGDNDEHARMPGDGYATVHACAFNQPQTAPAACTQGSFAGCTLGATADLCCPPTSWKTAVSISADDCNDEDPTANPAHGEICGNGLDDDCNGMADDSAICVCAGSSVSNCSDYNGQPITWPLGAPVAPCAYGTKTCAPDGKSWGPCMNTIPPAMMDGCQVQGDDANCNGIANEGCPCIQGDTQSCGSTVGSCTAGTETCDNTGHYGPCIGGTTPKGTDTCDPGNDDNCDGTPNENCSCINGTSCGKAATCNVGTWQDCVANGSGVCSGGPALTPVLWSYDYDGDTYCDLSKGQSVCPNATMQPVMPWKPLSSCASATLTDCNDMDATAHPNAPESCNNVDSNCNGSKNDGCACVPSGAVDCWTGSSPAGLYFKNATTLSTHTEGASICVAGSNMCTTQGIYTACMGETLPQPRACDGNDNDCDGTIDVNQGCAHQNGTVCGSAATCNQGEEWFGCKPDGTGCACPKSPPAPFPPGTPCDWAGNTNGVCHNGGTYQCTGADTGATSCSSKNNPNVDTSSGETSGAGWISGNEAWDWDCNGSVSNNLYWTVGPSKVADNIATDTNTTDASQCYTDGLTGGGFEALCQTFTMANCGIHNVYVCTGFLSPIFPGGNGGRFCDDPFYNVPCVWYGGTCVRKGGETGGTVTCE